jgi:hypothetical protein
MAKTRTVVEHRAILFGRDGQRFGPTSPSRTENYNHLRGDPRWKIERRTVTITTSEWEADDVST